jgi:hypothetical protein
MLKQKLRLKNCADDWLSKSLLPLKRELIQSNWQLKNIIDTRQILFRLLGAHEFCLLPDIRTLYVGVQRGHPLRQNPSCRQY